MKQLSEMEIKAISGAGTPDLSIAGSGHSDGASGRVTVSYPVNDRVTVGGWSEGTIAPDRNQTGYGGFVTVKW